MYVRKIMVCNVTNFSYNRGPPGGGLYCGSIGSIKDRCVIGTCEKNNFFRFPLWTRVWHLKCLQDIQWECFMKTRGQNIQKRPITDRPKIFRRTGRVPSQNVYSNLYSQAVTHPSTNRSQPLSSNGPRISPLSFEYKCPRLSLLIIKSISENQLPQLSK